MAKVLLAQKMNYMKYSVSACFSAVIIENQEEDCATDTEAPEVTCVNGLRFLRNAQIFGLDAIDQVSDNCAEINELTYTIQLAEDFTGVIPNNLFLEFNEPGIYNAYIWVTDLSGNASYCKTNLIVEDMSISNFN